MQGNTLGSLCFLTILVCVVCRDADLKPFADNRAFRRSHSVRIRRADEQEPPQISVDDIGRSGYPIYDSWEDLPTYGLGGFGSPVYTHGQASAQAQSNAYADAAAQAEYQYGPGYRGYGDEQGIAYGQSNAQSLAESDAHAYAGSKAQAVAQSNAQGLAQSKAYALAEGYAEAVAQGDAHALSQSDAFALADGNSQAVAHSESQGLGQSNTYAYSESNANVVSQSNAKGLGYSDAYAFADNDAHAVAQSNAQGLGYSDTYAFADNDAHAVAQSNAQGLGQSDAYSLAESHAEAVAQSNAEYAFGNNYQTHYSEPILDIPMYYQYGPYGSGQPNFLPDSSDFTKSEGLRALGSVMEEPLYSAELDADESKFGYEHSLAHAFAGSYSRAVPREDQIMPHSMPGLKNIIRCSAEGEFHSLWSPVFDCMVCVCLREGYSLVPACVKCNCARPEQAPPVIEAPVVVQSLVPTPLPQPESQVSCDPLPTDTPFEDPRNPCQICICQRTINSLGQPDIQITCEENPECLVPPQPLPLPQPQPQPHPQPSPIPAPEPEIVPTVPEPADLMCRDHPVNVPFQHPDDVCSVCVCVLGDFGYDMVCHPNPECEVRPIIMPEVIHPIEPLPAPIPIPETLPPEHPQPYPESVPEVYPEPVPVYPEPEVYQPIPDTHGLEPYPEIIRENIPLVYPEPAPQVIHPFEPTPVHEPKPHPEPYPELYPELVPNPEPEIIVPEVLPVPAPKPTPDVTPIPEDLPEPVPWPPAVPSPLPGPPPHESCHPYPPNTPFQHPWDVCQICVCSEVVSGNIINIEVNCYTSKLCCIEPPFSGPVLQPLGISGPPTSYSAPPAHIKFIDKICEQRSLEVEFVNPNDACKTCKCEVYGNLVVPVCKRAPKAECVVTPVSPSGDVVYIEPRCRYRVPSQYFRVDGSICVCESIYRYVTAKCVKLQLNAGLPHPEGGASKVLLPPYSTAQSNAVDSWQRPIISPYPAANLPAASYPINVQRLDSSSSPYYWLQNYPGMLSDAMPHNSGFLKPLSPQISRPGKEYYLDHLNYEVPSDLLYQTYLGPMYSEPTYAAAHSSAQSNDGPDVHDEPVENYTPTKLHDREIIKPNIHPLASNLYDDVIVQHPYYIRPTNAPINIGNPHLNYGNLYNWNPYGHLQIQGSSEPHMANDVNSLHLNAISNAEADVQTDSTMNSYYNLLKNIYSSNYINQNNGQPHGIPYSYYNHGDVLRNRYSDLSNPYYLSQNGGPINAQATSQSLSEIGQSDAHSVAVANAQANSAQSNAQSHIHIPLHEETFVEGDKFVNALANAQATKGNILENHYNYPHNDGLLPGYTQTNAKANAAAHLHSDALSNVLANAQANAVAVDQLTNALANAQANSQTGSSDNTQYFSHSNAYANSLSDAQAMSQANVQAHGGDSQAFAQASAISNPHNYPPFNKNIGMRPRLFGNRWRYVDKSGKPDDAKFDDDLSAEDDRLVSPDSGRLNLPNILTPISITVKPGDEKTLTTRLERQDASEVFDHHLPNTQVEKHENTPPPTPLASTSILPARRSANSEALTAPTSPPILESPPHSTTAPGKSGLTGFSTTLPVSVPPALQQATRSESREGSDPVVHTTPPVTSSPMNSGSTVSEKSEEPNLSTTPALSMMPASQLHRRSENSEGSSSSTSPPVTTSSSLHDTTSENTEASTLPPESSLGTTTSHKAVETMEAATSSLAHAPVPRTVISPTNGKRHARKHDRSTSSSSGETGSRSSRDSNDDSLGISVEEEASLETSGDSAEKITGWRKYHRICPPCPEDMAKKATDKSILWVCGGYQRARRTFKSVCMMRLRNCQDGTMFVKLYDGFCKAPQDGRPLGEHFFYDDKEKKSEESTDVSDGSVDKEE